MTDETVAASPGAELPPDSQLKNPVGNPSGNPLENPEQKPFSLENNPENEPSRAGSTVEKTSLAEKLRTLGRNVVQGRGITFQKGPGRPRNDGLPGKADTVIGGDEKTFGDVVGTPDSAGGDTLDDLLFRKSIAQAFKGVISFGRWMLRNKMEEAEFEQAFIDKAIKENRDLEAERDFDTALALVCQKYKVKSKWGPEFNLMVSTGRMVAPLIMTYRMVAAECKKRDEERNAAKHAGKATEEVAK